MKKHFILIVLIVLVILVWYKTLNQTFLGEGFYYFDKGQDFFSKGKIVSIWEYDNFAKILFDILPPIFQDNLQLYQGFQLLILIVLTLVFYKFIKYFSKNSWLSFTGAVIFCTSYLGLFEMIGVSNYQRFVQRIPNQIPLLLSFIQLAKFYDSNNIKNYFYSLILFTISVFMAHFSTFWLPIFVIYPVIYSICNKTKIPMIIKNIAYLIPFVLINLFLISRGVHTPNTGFFSFIKDHGIVQITTQMILQLSNMLIPPFLIEKIASVTSSYGDVLIILTIPIIIIFLLGIYLVKKRQINLLVIYLLSIVSIPILLFLNLYLGKINPLYNMRGYTYYFLPNFYSSDPSLTATLKGDRSYMLPYFFLAIIIAILIYVLFRRKFIYKIITFAFIAVYIFYNILLVKTNIAKIQPASEDMKKYLSYMKSISKTFNNQSIIIVPKEFMWPSSMIRTLYGHPDMQFIANYTDWEKQIKNADKKNVTLIDFYYEKTKDGRINPDKNRVIPLLQ